MNAIESEVRELVRRRGLDQCAEYLNIEGHRTRSDTRLSFADRAVCADSATTSAPTTTTGR